MSLPVSMQVYNAVVSTSTAAGSVASTISEGTAYEYAMTPIIKYSPAMNDFIDTLVNKIIQLAVRRELYNSPYSNHKRKGSPLGWTYEIKYVNPSKGRNYSLALGNTLLDSQKPDVKVEYYNVNRQMQYWVTVPRELYMGGWSAWGQLDDFISQTVDSLANGNQRDEVEFFKFTIVDAYNSGGIPKVAIDTTEYDSVSKALKKYLNEIPLEYSTEYNNYVQYAVSQGLTTAIPAELFTPFDRLRIIIKNENYIDQLFNTLAGAFNLSLVDFTSKVEIVKDFKYSFEDSFGVHEGSSDDLIAIICDEDAFTYRDTLQMSDNFHNAANLTNNIYLNVWQAYMFDCTKNAIAIVNKSTAKTLNITSVSIDPSDTLKYVIEGNCTNIDGTSGAILYGYTKDGKWVSNAIANTNVTINDGTIMITNAGINAVMTKCYIVIDSTTSNVINVG